MVMKHIHTPAASIITRRSTLTALGLLSVPWLAHAQAARTPLPLTPSQTEGPFYPVAIPADSDNDLLVTGNQRYAPSQRARVGGVVMDPEGRPVRGAIVEIWQCDERGHYHHPQDGARADPAFQGFGRATVDAEGRYEFRTLRPARYSGRTPHIHVKVKLGRHELLTTQLYVQGDAGNERDGLWRRLRAADREALTMPFTPQADGWLATQFPIVVQA